MRNNGFLKSFLSAALLLFFSWGSAAPAPIKRGELINGGAKRTVQSKTATAKAVQSKSRTTTTVKPKAKSTPVKVKSAPVKAKPAPVKAKSAPAKAEAKPVASSNGPRAPYRGAIAVDADTGRVLFADNARTTAYPASVTKLMTFLLVLEDMQRGLYGLQDRVTASKLAASMEPSKVGLCAGQSMTVHDLLLSIMVKSANDAAEALAEHSALANGGASASGQASPEDLRAAFVARMNSRAKELGMNDTRYASPNGLPPPRGSKRGFDVSTAVDLVKLGQVIVRMPKALEYTSRPSCTVTDGFGKPLTLAGHNYFIPKSFDSKHLCTPVEGCDGLKTGYTVASGSSIMLTAHRNGRRVIVVVLGSAGRYEREAAAGRILRDALGAISVW